MSRLKERRIQHYKSSQKILLVGEGDFSFSACLAKAFGYADNMVATCLESREWFNKNHSNSVSNLDSLESRECLVLFEVDAHDMDKHPTLTDMRFDVIIFNFPHAGHVSWLCERDTILIERHKRLLRGFFKSARKLLDENGEIHVTHRDDEPYCQWELEKQAQTAGLVVKEKVPFFKERYQGYHNKRGSDIKGNKKFPIILPFTSKFRIITGLDCGNNQISPPILLTDAKETTEGNIVGHDLLVDDFEKIAIGGVGGYCEEVKNEAIGGDSTSEQDFEKIAIGGVINNEADFEGNCEEVKNGLVEDEAIGGDSTSEQDYDTSEADFEGKCEEVKNGLVEDEAIGEDSTSEQDFEKIAIGGVVNNEADFEGNCEEVKNGLVEVEAIGEDSLVNKILRTLLLVVLSATRLIWRVIAKR